MRLIAAPAVARKLGYCGCHERRPLSSTKPLTLLAIKPSGEASNEIDSLTRYRGLRNLNTARHARQAGNITIGNR